MYFQHVTEFDGQSTSPQRSSAFTGCASQNVSTLNFAIMTYRSIHGTSPSCLQSCFTRVSDITSRRRLQSSTSHLDVPPVRLFAVSKRAFPVSCATDWNDLPLHVTSAPSLTVFRQRLKTFLFSRSYQDMTHVLLSPFITIVWTPVVLAIINII